ncbi:MAG: AraC family transcriptional regulator, partial [Anaerolineales bacterium]|nr:AraC family transcriptional regulator [Anaerolineales bacterium]
HFMAVTGMSPRKFSLIERARKAVDLLQTGLPASQVAVDAGYSDQPHLCRSLKAIMGQTPMQIQQTEE